MKASAEKFLLYTPEIETIRANEQEVSAQIAETPVCAQYMLGHLIHYASPFQISNFLCSSRNSIGRILAGIHILEPSRY
jgi:hypothetical protein